MTPYREHLSSILGVRACIGTGKYLGLPSFIGRNKRAVFNYIKDRVWRKISSWSSKMLSQAGREILIKSVAQAVPTYCMSVFLLTCTLQNELEKMMNSFWWGSKQQGRKGINWLSWEKLTVSKDDGGMGFRHLHGFNLAMLGRQGWKLFSDPEAMVSRVIKARYFPKGDYIGAALGHNPSYCWRSIWSAQAIVKEGYRWNIGNGQTINIWNQPWLRNKDDPRVHTEMIFEMRDFRVEQLINKSGAWKEVYVRSIFGQRDAKEILSIPPLRLDHPDVPIWRATKDGMYSVRSAYRICMDSLIQLNHLKREGPWRKIWSLQVPPKVRTFLWRVGRDCLPTRNKLRTRGVDCPDLCVCYDGGPENAWHIFLTCPDSVSCWKELGIWNELATAMNGAESFVEFFLARVGDFSEERMKLFGMTMWSIWRKRNVLQWDRTRETIRQVICRGVETLHAWEAGQETKRDTRSRTTDLVRWKSPPNGSLKCNVDAAIFEEEKCVGMGCCVRDHRGRFCRARSSWIRAQLSPLEAEAWCLHGAMKWMKDMEFRHVIFESDCKQLIDDINSANSNQSEYGFLVVACRDMICSNNGFSVVFAKRQANSSAHVLARASTNYAFCRDFDVVPHCILHIINDEMN